MKYSSPRDFFREVERVEPPVNRYVGELYFQAHRGTCTTQAKTKRGNRKAEFALREAEMWGAQAAAKAAGIHELCEIPAPGLREGTLPCPGAFLFFISSLYPLRPYRGLRHPPEAGPAIPIFSPWTCGGGTSRCDAFHTRDR